MARKSKKSKAQINKQLWDRANTSHRSRWQAMSQKGYDFYLNEQLSKSEKEVLEEDGNKFEEISNKDSKNKLSSL